MKCPQGQFLNICPRELDSPAEACLSAAADLWTGTMTSEEPDAAHVRVWPLQSPQLSQPAEEGKASGVRSWESG